MNNMKKLCALLLLCSTQVQVRPISETTATVGAIAGGVLAGAAAGAGTYVFVFNNTTGQPVRIAVSALVALGVGGLSWHLLSKLLHSMTPQGRYNAAQLLVHGVASDSLVNKNFTTVDELTSHITGRFGTSWPLVLAREHYMTLSANLTSARSLLNLAQQELQGNGPSIALDTQCNQLHQQITSLTHIIEPRLTSVTKHEKHDFQVGLYEKHQEAERQRTHESRLQHQRLGHDSLERLQDRQHDKELQNRKQVHESLEKSRDRLHDHTRDNQRFNHEDRLARL